MKRLALALLLASTTSAAAWTTDLTPPSATANANAAQTQRQHQAQVQRQKQHQHQSQSVTVNNTQTAPTTGTAPADPSAGTGGGIHNTDARAPDVVLPPVGGGGSDCPVVGFAAGGSGLGGGGGFGPGWISSRCDHRMYARLIYELTGDREEALRYLASVEPDVRDFVHSGVHVEPAAPPLVQPMHTVRPDWCATASIEEKLRHYRDCL